MTISYLTRCVSIYVALTLLLACQSNGTKLLVNLPLTEDTLHGKWRCSSENNDSRGLIEKEIQLVFLDSGVYEQVETIAETNNRIGLLRIEINSKGIWAFDSDVLSLNQRLASASPISKSPWEEYYYFAPLFSSDPKVRAARLYPQTFKIDLSGSTQAFLNWRGGDGFMMCDRLKI
jgi:hypothetical protein